MIVWRSHLVALFLVGACELYDRPAITEDAGADARAPELDASACPRVPSWREVECAVLCDPARELALCVGGDRNRCAFQCFALTPGGDYCPLSTPQF